MNEYKISFTWDDEVDVWIATSDDVYGLILEDSSLDTLVERVRKAVPELLSLEGAFNNNISLNYGMYRTEKLVANG